MNHLWPKAVLTLDRIFGKYWRSELKKSFSYMNLRAITLSEIHEKISYM